MTPAKSTSTASSKATTAKGKPEAADKDKDEGSDTQAQGGAKGGSATDKDTVDPTTTDQDTPGDAVDPNSTDPDNAFPVLAQDPTPTKAYTGHPNVKDPVVERGKGYDGIGNVYPEGVKAKVNKARHAVSEANVLVEEVRARILFARDLVKDATDDDRAEDVDDLHDFLSDTEEWDDRDDPDSSEDDDRDKDGK